MTDGEWIKCEFPGQVVRPEDLRFTDDVLYRQDHLFGHLMSHALYADDKPSTRWSRFKYRLVIYRDRVRDAWAVLRGRASVDGDRG